MFMQKKSYYEHVSLQSRSKTTILQLHQLQFVIKIGTTDVETRFTGSWIKSIEQF